MSPSSSASVSASLRGRVDALTAAAIAFAAANLLHTADHVRQGLGGLTWELLVSGSALSLLVLVTLIAVVRRHRRARLLAAVVGILGAIGVAASHVAPHWSVLSDPYPALHVDGLSWAVMLAEIGTGLALGLVGIVELRRHGRRAALTVVEFQG